MLDDFSVFFAEHGVSVVVGDSTITGLRREEPAEAFEGRAAVLARRYSVLCHTADLPAFGVGDAITVDGTAGKVKSWGPDEEHRDGRMTRIWYTV